MGFIAILSRGSITERVKDALSSCRAADRDAGRVHVARLPVLPVLEVMLVMAFADRHLGQREPALLAIKFFPTPWSAAWSPCILALYRNHLHRRVRSTSLSTPADAPYDLQWWVNPRSSEFLRSRSRCSLHRLPDAHRAPDRGSVIAAVLLKMGTTGSCASACHSAEATRLQPIVRSASSGSYGALVALAQRLKRLSRAVGQPHAMVLGMFALNPAGIRAASSSSSITAFRPAPSSSSSVSSTNAATPGRFPSTAACRR